MSKGDNKELILNVKKEMVEQETIISENRKILKQNEELINQNKDLNVKLEKIIKENEERSLREEAVEKDDLNGVLRIVMQCIWFTSCVVGCGMADHFIEHIKMNCDSNGIKIDCNIGLGIISICGIVLILFSLKNLIEVSERKKIFLKKLPSYAELSQSITMVIAISIPLLYCGINYFIFVFGVKNAGYAQNLAYAFISYFVGFLAMILTYKFKDADHNYVFNATTLFIALISLLVSVM